MTVSASNDSAQPILTPTGLLFTYGTLMFEPVWLRVVGRNRPSLPAVAAGWSVRCVAGRPYPAIVSDPDAIATGRLYQGLSERDFARLDRYEGAEYERRAIDVRLADNSIRQVFAYVARPAPYCRVSTELWDPTAFAAEHLVE
ncbi:gamma-glutamylcyclotransferase family protein [Botrimarina hoheduenensis]|uniref:Putative gamma-glutamylcyclotransferase n=1 Tax=Botrimarina hoheduenensis TaxID=2528000 RepID=A0A5C5WEK8_9BACT|nr:gamma-glutamylcyclotransferase family protein [Botrimarina hoheduenensis]TWT48485.1 AIG2-like family protein [Botrimarina hoheduenensis]